MELSKRLQTIANMVTPGNRTADVGCDHGFVSIYLFEKGISPKVYAMDVRTGPLARAKEHIAEYGYTEYIETRLSDGLKAYQKGEADALICAGMGGRLMMQILCENEDKTASFKELILQPQSDIEAFRAFLRKQGYQIVEENMIEEDGKYYPMMKAVKEGKINRTIPQGESSTLAWHQRMEDKYGPLLLQKKHPVLYRYLEREKRICEEILGQLQVQGLDDIKRSNRYEEINRQLQDCIKVLAEMA